MSKRPEIASVDRSVVCVHGGSRVIQLTTLLAEVSDDGDMWEMEIPALIAVRNELEAQIAEATARSFNAGPRKILALKHEVRVLSDKLEAVMRELDRRGALLTPIISNHFWH